MRKPSNLPKRPRSCCGRIETLASPRTTNEYRESLPNARNRNVTYLRSFSESLPKQGWNAPGSRSPQDRSLRNQADLCAKKELGWKSVGEQHDLVVRTKGALQNHEKRPDTEVAKDLAGDRSAVHIPEPSSNLATKQNIHRAEHNDTLKNEPPVKPQERLPDPPVETGKDLGVSLHSVLSIRTRAQIMSRKPFQPAPHFGRVEKRIMEKEDEALEAMVSKKRNRRAKITKTLVQSAIVAETPEIIQSNSSFKPTPSRFLESGQ